jgi:uncharacterized membrane protein
MQVAEKFLYWIATLLMLLLMGFSVYAYHASYETMAGYFETFGYPTYLVYPLAYAKLLAMIVIITNRYRNLKDIAYGAYYINMIMATTAHLMHGDQPIHAYVGLVVVPISYILSNRVRGEPKHDAFVLSK